MVVDIKPCYEYLHSLLIIECGQFFFFLDVAKQTVKQVIG